MPARKIIIVALPGDGIGPEVTRQAVRALETIAEHGECRLEIHEHPAGGCAVDEFGTPLPRATLDACLGANAVLLGAVGGPKWDDRPRSQRPETGLLQLRSALGGFANLRPATFLPALSDCSPLRPEVAGQADIVVVRELLGGLYFGEPRGYDREAGEAHNTMRYGAEEVGRIARVAFDLARGRRRKVTSVDKANVLEVSQLWRQTVQQVAHAYPDVALDHMYVDACAMHLVTNPARFDVILTENLFGDVLSDEAAALTGSLGMLPSATIGGPVNLYEPIHGSAPDIAGRDIANPLGAIASAAMLLRYSGALPQAASHIEAAITAVLKAGYRTADLARGRAGQVVGTTEMGSLVCGAIRDAYERQFAYHAV
ncbi:MAG: 3-isopropylmalate dehydrogenase [Acidobacteria bacterium]|nr:3-isopropylmalate dehydrogenase [Acidobacteriota bacterium]